MEIVEIDMDTHRCTYVHGIEWTLPCVISSASVRGLFDIHSRSVPGVYLGGGGGGGANP